jgi:hypothetical protein
MAGNKSQMDTQINYQNIITVVYNVQDFES